MAFATKTRSTSPLQGQGSSDHSVSQMASDTQESDYVGRKALTDLFLLAFLPLIDGYLFAFLAAVDWRQPALAAAFGMTALAGAGTFSAATQLRGTPILRIKNVILVYVLIAILTLVSASFKSMLAGVLPMDMPLFTGLFLMGLGLRISGVRIAQTLLKYVKAEAAVSVAIAIGVLNVVRNGIAGAPSFDADLLPFVGVAVGSALGISMTGCIFGLVAAKWDSRPLKIGAGVSLVAMGVNLIFGILPTALIPVPILIGVLIVLLRRRAT